MNHRSIATLWVSVCCVLGAAAAGCATTQGELNHGIGAGQWQARLPTTASPIHELAYGRGGSGQASDELADLDDLFRPEHAVAAKTQPKPVKQASTLAPKRVVAHATPAAPAPEPAAAPEPASPPPAAAMPVLLAENDAHDRYASREQSAQQQQQYRGGDAVVVISASALVIVLLIVLLILLLR